MLYRIVLFPMFFSDPLLSKTTSVFAFHIFVTGGHRDFKFDHSKSQLKDDHLPGAWSGSRGPF